MASFRLLSYLFHLPELQDGAWYEPSPPEKVETILKLLELQPDDRVVDLGSGDGRIVIGAALKGATSVGIEKKQKLVKESRQAIDEADVVDRASIIHANFWDIDLSEYNKVVTFQFHTVMERLEVKLRRELRPGSMVVSNYWTFPHWHPQKADNDVFRYILL